MGAQTTRTEDRYSIFDPRSSRFGQIFFGLRQISQERPMVCGKLEVVRRVMEDVPGHQPSEARISSGRFLKSVTATGVLSALGQIADRILDGLHCCKT